MNAAFSRPRKLALAFTALVVAALLFHTQLADALVARGDQLLLRGQVVRAVVFYARALRFDPDSEVAADRLVFGDLQQSTRLSLAAGAAAATKFLTKHPTSAMIIEDRALCWLRMRRYTQAKGDFAAAGRLSHAARDFVFAGWCAYRASDLADARVFWHAALRVEPAYAPAAIALAEHGR